MKFTATREDLARTDYGRGADVLFPGARFAVVSTGAGGKVDHVLRAHRTEAAAVKTLRRAVRTMGHMHIAEIV